MREWDLTRLVDSTMGGGRRLDNPEAIAHDSRDDVAFVVDESLSRRQQQAVDLQTGERVQWWSR